MSKPIKYGIVGAGHLGNYHAQQLKKISCVKLIGVFDLDLKKSSLFSKSYKIKYFKSLKNLLNECDAVSITSPATAHHKNAIEGLSTFNMVFLLSSGISIDLSTIIADADVVFIYFIYLLCFIYVRKFSLPFIMLQGPLI